MQKGTRKNKHVEKCSKVFHSVQVITLTTDGHLAVGLSFTICDVIVYCFYLETESLFILYLHFIILSPDFKECFSALNFPGRDHCLFPITHTRQCATVFAIVNVLKNNWDAMKYFSQKPGTCVLMNQKLLRCEFDLTMVTLWASLTVQLL